MKNILKAGILFALVQQSECVVKREPTTDWLTDRYTSRILRYDPNIEAEMAEKVMDIGKTRRAIKYLEKKVADYRWNIKESFEPDTTDKEMLKQLREHAAQ